VFLATEDTSSSAQHQHFSHPSRHIEQQRNLLLSVIRKGMCMMNEPSTALKRSMGASQSGPPQKKQRIIMSSLPKRMTAGTSNDENDTSSDQSKNDVGPQDYLVSLLECRGAIARISPSLAVEGFFADPTDDEVNAYAHDVLTAIRTRDIEKLREFHESGRPLKCSNAFGESLLHLACRRGFFEVAAYLIKDAGVTVRVRDDYGRTPLHDACWTCEPNFDLLELIITACPDLLLMSDKRGNTPLEYARPEQWQAYKEFLRTHQDLFTQMQLKQ
jgi:hypothetical protein